MNSSWQTLEKDLGRLGVPRGSCAAIAGAIDVLSEYYGTIVLELSEDMPDLRIRATALDYDVDVMGQGG